MTGKQRKKYCVWKIWINNVFFLPEILFLVYFFEQLLNHPPFSFFLLTPRLFPFVVHLTHLIDNLYQALWYFFLFLLYNTAIQSLSNTHMPRENCVFFAHGCCKQCCNKRKYIFLYILFKGIFGLLSRELPTELIIPV